jgi:hypothetical protein
VKSGKQMSRKRKKKGQKRGPRRKRMRRQARLASARTWLPTFSGRNIVRGYARWYGVDPLCAIKELRLLGVKVSDDYEAQVLGSIEQRALARARKHAVQSPESPVDSCRADWLDDWYVYGDEAPEGWNDEIPLADPGADLDWELDQRGEDEELPIEYAFLEDVFALDLKVIETNIETIEAVPPGEALLEGAFPGVSQVRVRIVLEEDPEVLAARAWSLIFVLGVFSYADARPQTGSGARSGEYDEWTVDDMLRRLSFERGRLSFHADQVRGRCMRTTIEIDRDGKITLETVDRGEAATRWISKLRGKRMRPRAQEGGGLDAVPF